MMLWLVNSNSIPAEIRGSSGFPESFLTGLLNDILPKAFCYNQALQTLLIEMNLYNQDCRPWLLPYHNGIIFIYFFHCICKCTINSRSNECRGNCHDEGRN